MLLLDFATILNNTTETDNRSFLRFGDKLTDYKMDSINYGTIEGNLTRHYFDPSDIIKIRKDKKLKSVALDWSINVYENAIWINDWRREENRDSWGID